MNTLLAAPLLVLASHLGSPSAPEPLPVDPPPSAAVTADVAASGNVTQTGITSLRTTTFGPITILDQAAVGVVRVVELPTGAFFAQFTLSVDGIVQGQQGGLTRRAADVG